MRPLPFRGFRIAIKSLIGHPLRVGLAVLAIMIGVASVIVMVGIGRGAEDEVRKKIEGMGTNLIVVSAGQSRAVKGQVGQLGIMTTLILKDAWAMAEECPSVKRVAPAHSRKLPVKFENMSYTTRIVGTVPLIQVVRNISIDSGAFFDEDENRLMAPVAVVGPTVVQTLFAGRDPVGESIRIGKVLFKVIGVTASKGAISGEDEDDQILVPLRTAMNKLMNVTYLSNIFVEAKGFEDIHSAQAEIRSLLRERHRLREGKDDDFTIQNQADVIEAQSSVARTFSLLVASIAVISLIIGGVGILGVMLLSIRERVSEIGIRRAVGARRRDILVQFLVESSFLGVLGGTAGLVLGLGGAAGARHFSGMPVLLAPDYVILSLFFSIATGLIFGIYPSWTAARLDPIEALTTKAQPTLFSLRSSKPLTLAQYVLHLGSGKGLAPEVVILRSGRVVLRVRPSIECFWCHPGGSGLKPHFSLRLDSPTDFHSDIRTELNREDVQRLSQMDFQRRSVLPRILSQSLRKTGKKRRVRARGQEGSEAAVVGDGQESMAQGVRSPSAGKAVAEVSRPETYLENECTSAPDGPGDL